MQYRLHCMYNHLEERAGSFPSPLFPYSLIVTQKFNKITILYKADIGNLFFESFKTTRKMLTYFQRISSFLNFKIFNFKVTFFQSHSRDHLFNLSKSAYAPPPFLRQSCTNPTAHKFLSLYSAHKVWPGLKVQSVDTVCLVLESGLFPSLTFGYFKRYLKGIRGF